MAPYSALEINYCQYNQNHLAIAPQCIHQFLDADFRSYLVLTMRLGGGWYLCGAAETRDSERSASLPWATQPVNSQV